jgi:hypothetical protein
MWIALILLTGVILGVAWLSYSMPPCMRCWRHGHCQRATQCQGESKATVRWRLSPPRP